MQIRGYPGHGRHLERGPQHGRGNGLKVLRRIRDPQPPDQPADHGSFVLFLVRATRGRSGVARPRVAFVGIADRSFHRYHLTIFPTTTLDHDFYATNGGREKSSHLDPAPDRTDCTSKLDR